MTTQNPPLTLEVVNRRPKTCLQCGGLFRVAYPTSESDKSRIFETKMKGGAFPAMKFIHELTRCDLRDAKGTSFHLTITPGKCHRCHKDIAEEEFVDCPHCQALNIFPPSEKKQP